MAHPRHGDPEWRRQEAAAGTSSTRRRRTRLHARRELGTPCRRQTLLQTSPSCARDPAAADPVAAGGPAVGRRRIRRRRAGPRQSGGSGIRRTRQGGGRRLPALPRQGEERGGEEGEIAARKGGGEIDGHSGIRDVSREKGSIQENENEIGRAHV